MPRKPRQRRTPDLAPVEAPVPPESREQAPVYPLTGPLRDRLEAIVSGCIITATIDAAVTAAAAEELEPESSSSYDLFASDDFPSPLGATADEEDVADGDLADTFGGVALTTRLLARSLLALVLDRRPVRGSASLVTRVDGGEPDEASAAAVAQSLLPANLPKELRGSKSERREALGDAAWVIREVGLEEFDVSCELATPPGQPTQLIAEPVTAETAHVMLLDYLVERAEAMVTPFHPLLATELDASAWEFSCWSAAPPPGPGQHVNPGFARGVREQEYSLAERRTVSTGRSVMGEIAADERFAAMFPRQHRMAVALNDSIVGLFECVSLDGSIATLRSVTDDRTFPVHEHLDPMPYEPGWFGAGRLLPFGDGMYLRSPGMVFFTLGRFRDIAPAAQAFVAATATMPPGLALEAVISSHVLGIAVPREIEPARSRRDAALAFAVLGSLLAPAEPQPEPPRPGMYYVPGAVDEPSSGDEMPVPDETLLAFIAALHEQAERGGGDRARPARTRRGKRKRRR